MSKQEELNKFLDNMTIENTEKLNPKIKVSEARNTELHNLYSMWLMDYAPEDIGCKEHLLELEENQTYSEEFLKWVEENI